MNTADLLFEIGTEELPAGFIDPALDFMRREFEQWMQKLNLTCAQVRTLSTPRRLALQVSELQLSAETREQEVIGPAQNIAYDAQGNLTKAGQGFLRSRGIDPEDARLVDTPRGRYLGATQRIQGADTASELPGFLVDLVQRIPFRKSMKWGTRSLRFGRPITHFVLLLGDKVLPMEIEGIHAGRISRGHRFLGADQVEIPTPEHYESVLENQYVIVDVARRRQMIRDQIAQLSAELDAQPVGGEDLVELTANLVEYPAALMGRFEARYLELPRKLLVTTMREHQKYFAVADAQGELCNAFITIGNMPIEDLDAIRQGNERVLRARLADAWFYFEEDLRAPLADRMEELDRVVFQEQLGTIGAKVRRIEELALWVAEQIGMHSEDRVHLQRAALLAKCDLATGMVYEFPELQGDMGREYALRQDEAPDVAQAILEHWFPRHAGDDLPSNHIGALLSIADKMDTIVGCFGVGLLPSGSNDPYALRRLSIGVFRILRQYRIGIALDLIVDRAVQALGDRLTRNADTTRRDVFDFIVQRCKVYFQKNEGYAYDIVDAVFSAGFSDVPQASGKLAALHQLKQRDGFRDLVETFRRAVGILPEDFEGVPAPELLQEDAERLLHQRIADMQPRARTALESGAYEDAFGLIVELRPDLDRFFDQVMVNVDQPEVRHNRLALMQQVRDLFASLLDFRRLVLD